MKWGELTPFTCPECRGVLVKLQEGKPARVRCHTCHAFTPSALLAGITAVVGETMWQAMRGLEEATMLLRQMGDEFHRGRRKPELFYEKGAGGGQECTNCARFVAAA